MIDFEQKKFAGIVVDDEEIIRNAIGDALSEIPLVKFVVRSPNGTDALFKVQNQHFNFAIVDLSMPRMGGIELIQRIRDIEKQKKLPPMYIAIISGSVQSEEVVEAVKMGVKDILVKPFNLEDIISKITAVLEKKS